VHSAVTVMTVLRWASRDHLGSPALAQVDWPGPGRHPGHPTAEGGLPTSKPGLRAGTRDLTEGSTTFALSVNLRNACLTERTHLASA